MTKLQTAGPEKLHGLDHLRALAIAWVFFFHYPNVIDLPDWAWDVKDFGWVGVDLFFVLSGFLIARQLFSELKATGTISVKQFFLKRFFRIIPVYLLVVAVYFLVPLFREKESLPALWRFLTFTQNIGLDPSVNGTFSHAWSLCVEEQFYFLFPLIILLTVYLHVTKKGAYIILGFFLLTFFIRLYLWYHYMEPLIEAGGKYSDFWITWLYYPTHTRLDGLLTGISIAGLVVYYPAFKEKITRWANFLLLAGIVILTAAYYVCQNRVGFSANIFGYPLIAFGFGFVVLAAISPACILYRFKSRTTSSIAILSYSIYLIHKGVRHVCIVYFGKLGVDEKSYWMMLIIIACTILGALILRYTIEKPFLKLRDKLLDKKANPAIVP